jgi:cytochrome c5
LQKIYADSAFIDQKVNWGTHPTNVGHIDSPGCFRCHDGKHLNDKQEAIRLECNLCHSIPVVAGAKDFVATIEISRGIEPETHRSPNWISLHNKVFDATCSNCHKTDDPGGTSNTSFCSNSACHGNVFTFAGFDAPKLREILQAQLPTPQPTVAPAPVNGAPTFNANIGPILASKCTACHGTTPALELSFLTYASTMKGSKNGPVILPGDSAGSKLVTIQSATHFANLSPAELEMIKQWIDAGAVEQ